MDKSTDVIYSMTGFGPVQPNTGRVKLIALNPLHLHLNTLLVNVPAYTQQLAQRHILVKLEYLLFEVGLI